MTASEAFGLYWNYFKEHKGETDEMLKRLATEEELSWWQHIKKGVDGAARGLKWVWDDIRLKVGHKTFSFKSESEIETILTNF